MRKVYVDVGGWNGDTVEGFYKGELTITYGQHEFEIYVFEPSPRWREILEKLAQSNKRVTFYPHAAWNANGEAEFTLEEGQAGTIVERNDLWHQYEHVTVPTIDFSEWLKNNFTEEDYVVVKIDVEGAEYAILEKMIDDKTYNLVDKLIVEFHERLFIGDDSPIYKQKEAYIKSIIPNIIEWH